MNGEISWFEEYIIFVILCSVVLLFFIIAQANILLDKNSKYQYKNKTLNLGKIINVG